MQTAFQSQSRTHTHDPCRTTRGPSLSFFKGEGGRGWVWHVCNAVNSKECALFLCVCVCVSASLDSLHTSLGHLVGVTGSFEVDCPPIMKHVTSEGCGGRYYF